MRTKAASISLLLAFAVGCASTALQTDPIPAAFRAPGLEFYVQNHGADKRRLDQIIAADLTRRGLHATSGFAADRPAKVDVLVVYEDRWQWDLSNYLIFMRIDLRDPMTNVLLVTGSSYQTSLARKEPDKVIALITTGFFK